jgi:O-antigen biosynthesis protein
MRRSISHFIPVRWSEILVDIAASLSGQSVRVLLYHSISDDQRDPFAVPLPLFREHMTTLAMSGVPVVSCAQLLAALEGAKPMHRAVCITFDDGLDDFATSALPVLREHRFASALFVCTVLVGSTEMWRSWSGPRSLIDWAGLTDLLGAGVEIGSHGSTHVRLGDLGESALVEELGRSRSDLASHLERHLDVVAYPFGDYSPVVRVVARDVGYRAGFAVGGLWGNHRGTDRFALKRILITRDVQPKQLEKIVRGTHDVTGAMPAAVTPYFRRT